MKIVFLTITYFFVTAIFLSPHDTALPGRFNNRVEKQLPMLQSKLRFVGSENLSGVRRAVAIPSGKSDVQVLAYYRYLYILKTERFQKIFLLRIKNVNRNSKTVPRDSSFFSTKSGPVPTTGMLLSVFRLPVGQD